MGKIRMLAVSLSCLFLMAACGAKGEEQPQTGQFPSTGAEAQLDVVLDGDGFCDVAPELKGGAFLGMQFYKGEPVQLWASAPRKKTVSVYLYRKDGTRETVLEEAAWDDTLSGGYLDDAGNYYGIADNRITKLDASGQTLFSVSAGEKDRHDSIEEICCVPGGNAALAARITDPETSIINMTLMELGQEGKLSKVEFKSSKEASYENMPSYTAHLGSWGEDLLLMDGGNIYKLDLKAGTLAKAVSLDQSAYAAQQRMPLESEEDIRAVYIPESGKVELLWAYSSGKGRCESLSFKDMTKEREIITLSGIHLDSWLKEQIVKFNSGNDKYYISVKTSIENTHDFIVNTGVEIATGKGPELLYGRVMLDSVGELIEKGGLVDLAPLMKQSGIREEDYFPMTFMRWREGEAVYAIVYKACAQDYLIKAEVLGDIRNPDMETLLDALLAYPEQSVLISGGSGFAKNLLRNFLYGSETLYGMIDWEAGTCDFSGELFYKLLEVVKRYQFLASRANSENYPVLMKTRATGAEGAYRFKTVEEYEAEGYVPVYYMFDDGIYPALDRNNMSRDFSLYINANSKNPEAAWEFLSFILSEAAQETVFTGDPFSAGLPVMKKVFLSEGQNLIDNGWPGGRRVQWDITRESVEAEAEYFENTRDLPWRTEPIVEIIVEEAGGYFNGAKELQQVRDVVQNRVQLYIDEHK